MPFTMSRLSFHKGLEFYKAGNYQEALGHFNEVNYLDSLLSDKVLSVHTPIQAVRVHRGGQNLYQLLDTRAAVHEKLGQDRKSVV